MGNGQASTTYASYSAKETLDRGFRAAFTTYPKTKVGNQRKIDVVRKYGPGRIIVDSSADWGNRTPWRCPGSPT